MHCESKKQSTRRALTRTIVLSLLALMIGWISCECLLRILAPKTIFYSTWFTEGAHQRDAEFGFVFRPYYRGAMRNTDLVWNQPIRLNANGFRYPAVRAETGTANPTRVVMLGGASMAFGYGLDDAECLHHRVASHLEEDCRIDLISWPGFTLTQDLRKVQRFSDPSIYDLAVLFLYAERDYRFQPDWDRTGPIADIQMIDSVVTTDNAAARLGGRLYYNSYVVAGLCRAWQVPGNLLSRFDVPGNVNESSGSIEAAETFADRRQMHLAASWLLEQGVQSVLVVALPRQSQHVGPSVLGSSKDERVKVLDLRSVLNEQSIDWIAYGHYGPETVEKLANSIAEAIELED